MRAAHDDARGLTCSMMETAPGSRRCFWEFQGDAVAGRRIATSVAEPVQARVRNVRRSASETLDVVELAGAAFALLGGLERHAGVLGAVGRAFRAMRGRRSRNSRRPDRRSAICTSSPSPSAR